MNSEDIKNLCATLGPYYWQGPEDNRRIKYQNDKIILEMIQISLKERLANLKRK